MKIFVNCTAADRALVLPVVKALRDRGHEVDADLDARAGDCYGPRREERIRCYDKVVVLWTRNSVRCSAVRAEAERARRAGKLLPLRLRVRPPLGFRDLHTPALPLLGAAADVAAVLGLDGVGTPELRHGRAVAALL